MHLPLIRLQTAPVPVLLGHDQFHALRNGPLQDKRESDVKKEGLAMGKIQVETCGIEGLKVITPAVYGGERGY